MLDSLHAKSEGQGSWRFDFSEAFEVKEGEVVQVDDVTFQHSFPSLDENSQRVYVVYQHGSTKHGEILNLPIGVYNATQIKDELQSALNAGYRWNGSNSEFVATLTNGIISVSVNYAETPPDLSGLWEFYNSNSKQAEVNVTKVNSTTYTHTRGGVVYTWTIDDFHTANRTLEITETSAPNPPQAITWVDADQRLVLTGTPYNRRRKTDDPQQWQSTEQFYIVDEHTVRMQAFHFIFQSTFTGPDYDIHNTKSANSLLGHTKYHPSGELIPMLTTQTLGHCSIKIASTYTVRSYPAWMCAGLLPTVPHASRCFILWGRLTATSLRSRHIENIAT